MKQSKVYFTTKIDAKNLVKMYEVLNKSLAGNVAVKISTGEAGNPNYLNPDLIKDLVHKVNGTIVECNTAYEGKREITEDHKKTARDHGFFNIADVDIMDEDGSMEIPVVNGKYLNKNYVGEHLKNYDAILMLSHFKGHPMGGFGGALKNMSIGIASAKGKCWIHTAGKVIDPKKLWDHVAPQDEFLESMAEADSAVIDYMKNNIVYINVINNISVDCDCVANPEAPCMKDIGIVASLDPVAIDQACLDLIYNSNDTGKEHFKERVETRHGQHILEYAVTLGLGSRQYELINIEEDR